MRDAVQVRILGRLQVTVADRPVEVRSARQREMLARLALSVGQCVPIDDIAKALWGDDAVDKSAGSVHTVAFRLRRAIGADLVQNCREGYALRLPEHGVDLFRFRALAGKAGDDSAALRAALRLWRDEPFADLPSDWLYRTETPALLEEWYVVLEKWLDLELTAGRHAGLLGELRSLVSRYPLREKLWARYITALYRSGRQAEGFAAYRTVSKRLRENFGTDPGAELTAAYEAMLHAEPLPEPRLRGLTRPNTLPRDLETFTSRSEEVAELLAAGDTDGTASVVCVLEGMAGVGKTTLAVHAAHRLASRFPDGQVYVDLHGYTEGHPQLTPRFALAQLLAAIGEDRDRVPADEDEAAARWRTLLADRRVLVMLDNAADSDQVRPLLPGGAGCLTMVISRRRLAGIDGARIVPVGLPAAEDACRLFISVTGRDDLFRDDPAVDEVVRLCGRLPLALTIAAARLRHRPAWVVADLVARLRDERRRLDELKVENRSVASAWDLSLRYVPAAQRELLIYLSRFTRTAIDAYDAAALAGVPVPKAEAMLENLLDAHLIDEPTAGRYRMHDLVRLYCREHLAADGQTDAARRLLSYYLNTLLDVERLLRPGSPRRIDAIGEALPARPLTSVAGALEWCGQEHANLVMAVQIADELAQPDLTWKLSWLIWSYLSRGAFYAELIRVTQLGLVAARAVGSRRGEARHLNTLGMTHQDLGEYDKSLAYYQDCLAVAEAHGLPQMLTALNNIGVVYGLIGDYERALEYFIKASKVPGDTTTLSDALGNIGEAYRRLGKLESALDYGMRAWRLAMDIDDAFAAARKRIQLTETCRLLGDVERAIEHATQALAVLRDGGDIGGVGEVLLYLGNALHQRGDQPAARRVWQEAYDQLDRVGMPEAELASAYLSGRRSPQRPAATRPGSP